MAKVFFNFCFQHLAVYQQKIRNRLIWLKYFARDCATLKLLIFQVKFAVVGFGGQMILKNKFHQQIHPEKTSLGF